MAIRRFIQKPKVATFEGLEIGVRMPTTGEMLDITKGRQEYLRSTKEDANGDGEGDIELWFSLQLRASKLLACDPEDPTNPWFAENREDQDRLAKSGVFKDLAEEVPHRFHVAVWNVLTGVDGAAPLEKESQNESETTTNQEQNPTTDSEITSDSTPSLSESQSTSDAQSATLSDGNGTDSLSESNA